MLRNRNQPTASHEIRRRLVAVDRAEKLALLIYWPVGQVPRGIDRQVRGRLTPETEDWLGWLVNLEMRKTQWPCRQTTHPDFPLFDLLSPPPVG